jgi:hypothetical protein
MEPEAYSNWKRFLAIAESYCKSNPQEFYFYGSRAKILDVAKTKIQTDKMREEVFFHLQSVLQEIQCCEFPDGTLSFLGTLESMTSIVLEFIELKRSGTHYNNKFLDFFERKCQPPPSAMISSFCSKVNSYLEILMITYCDALKSRQVSVMKEYLTKFKEHERFLERLCHVSSVPQFRTPIVNIPVYSELVNKLSSELVKWKELLDQHFLGNPATTTVNSQDKDRFYLSIYSSFCAIQELNTLSIHINPQIFRLDQTISSFETHIFQELQLFEVELNQLLPALSSSIEMEPFHHCNLSLENLRSFSTQFKDAKLSSQAKNIFGNAERKLYSICLELKKEAYNLSSVSSLKELTQKIIQMKLIGVQIFQFSERIITILDALFVDILKTNANLIGALGIDLNNSKHPMAHRIIQDHKVFDNYQIHARNQKTLKFTIDHLLGTEIATEPTLGCGAWKINDKSRDFLRGSNVDEATRLRLRELYQEFDDKYWAHVEKGYLLEKQQQRVYLSSLVTSANSISIQQSIDTFDKYLEIGALVFSY